MKDLKFKAWHIEEKKMCQLALINLNAGAFLYGIAPGKDQRISDKEFTLAPLDGRYCNIDDFYLMQYTGIKDDNGVEIYDGYIIEKKWPSGSWIRYIIKFGIYSYCDNRNLRGNDSECGNGFYMSAILSDDGICKGDSALMDGAGYEIVGHIYGNPELLK